MSDFLSRLTPETARDWFELAGLGFVVLLVALLGWSMWTGIRLFADSRRSESLPAEGLSWESQLAAESPRRSPFAPDRSVVVVGDGSDLTATEVREVAK